MAAGTLTLTNNSDAVAGVGTAFSTELAAGDFIVANVGGIAYTLPVKAVASDTSLTMVSKFSGPTMSGLAWFFITRDQQAMVTAALVAQNTEALRVLNYDKANWQAVFSAAGDITVTLPDNTQFTGPSWQKVIQMLEDVDLDEVQALAGQVRADALQVDSDKTAAETAKTAAQAAKTSAESAASTASTAKTDAVAAKDAAQTAAGTATSQASASESSAVRAEAAAGSIDTTTFLRKDGNLSGLTNKSTARGNLDLKSAAVADILGTVSQSGGVPTGAVIESGSNANGAYVKWADGTMICQFDDTVNRTTSSSAGSIYTSAAISFPFPAAFSSLPSVAVTGRYVSGTSVAWPVQRARSITAAEIFSFGVNSGGSVVYGYIAVGRWF